ncbi:MAG TPA: protoporphyrinogen oxidase [Nitrospinota bacterium]|jgi:oxygen-dependent protoporphyrinogen oxidase|nr:protoporphyrinogen oxidase [Nitrospinota bacterium]HJN01560.1 protoporphyrinogen oxidase [Nitrospinota bacterium]
MGDRQNVKKIAIIGAGIAGLSAAYVLEKEAADNGISIEIDLIEKQSRIGGNILTERKDDFIVEGGPDCVFSEKPASLKLCEKLGLEKELLKTREEKKGTYVYWNNKLHDLPEGVILMIPTMIMPILLSSLISFPGKMRMALEPFIPKRSNLAEESLSHFVTRRLGKELLDKIAEPLVAGIHAGNPKSMSITASFPRFVELEQKYGSLIRGMLSRRKEMVSMMKGRTPKYTMFMTLKKGLQELTDNIQNTLIFTTKLTDKEVIAVIKKNSGYEASLKAGDIKFYDSVIIATPSYITSSLLRGVDSDLADKLMEIPYVSTATVSLAYSVADVNHIKNGFGFIVPGISNRKIMAATYTSNKFSYRAPEGSMLLRCFVGGAQNEDLVFLDNKEMIQMVKTELKDIVNIKAKPIFIKIYRWEKAMPQYVVGHIDRIKKIEELSAKHPGLYLTGSAYNGIGISDCITTSHKVAEEAVKFLKADGQ